MRAASVRRFAAGLFVATLIGAFAFAWLARPMPSEEASANVPGPASEAARGAELFVRHCGACHTAAELQMSLAKMPRGRVEELAAFLDTHGDAPADADRVILTYLEAAAQKK